MSISHKMFLAIQDVKDGARPKDAAEARDVTLQALYRAMRTYNVGDRCDKCGHLLTRAPMDANNG